MAYNAGVSKRKKSEWATALAAITTLKIALYTANTNLDATDLALAYGTAGTVELSATGTGYTTGGYAINPGATANGATYDITFADVALNSGTVDAGTYYAMIYDDVDANKYAVSVHSVTITPGSDGTTMTISIPDNAINIA